MLASVIRANLTLTIKGVRQANGFNGSIDIMEVINEAEDLE